MQKEKEKCCSDESSNTFSDIVPAEERAEDCEDRVLLKAVLSIAASLNHEINNPLTSILGNTQLLLESPLSDDPDSRKKLKTIEHDAIRIRHLLMKLNSMVSPSFFTYAGDEKLLDLRSSKYRHWIGEEE